MSVAPFNQSSYRTQVLRLRKLGRIALERYRLRVEDIEFINHGENTTFKVTANGGKKFLLRIHRLGYHTEAAIREELAWLEHLAGPARDAKAFTVPRPFRSKTGELLERVQAPGVEPRIVCVFHWIEGRFIGKRVLATHMEELGRLVALLHRNTPPGPVKHRRYWTADGLVGKKPKFGSLEQLPGIGKRDHEKLARGRKLVYAKLRAFERRFPGRQSLIHSDVHFGNVLRANGRFAAIDFDDCGFGFHAYDLVTLLISAEQALGPKRQAELPRAREAVIRGYKSVGRWDEHDEKILDHLVCARRVSMVGWLSSRTDNPKLVKYLKPAVRRAIKKLKAQYPELS